MAVTSCPHCDAPVPVPVEAEEGSCPECNAPLQFVDVPDRPCDHCTEPVALPPGRNIVRCEACGRLQAAAEGRDVIMEARCPRCRRLVTAKIGQEQASCGACGAQMVLEQP